MLPPLAPHPPPTQSTRKVLYAPTYCPFQPRVCARVSARVSGKEEQGHVPEAKWDRGTASSNQIVLLIGDTATGSAGLSETPVIVSSNQTSDLRGLKKTHTLGFFALLSYQHLQRYLIPARPSFYDALSVYPKMPLTSHRFQGRRRSIPIFSKTVGTKGANGTAFVAKRPLGIACKHYFTS